MSEYSEADAALHFQTINARAAALTEAQRRDLDDARMCAVDRERVRPSQPYRDKRIDDSALRFVRRVGNHNLLLAACACPYSTLVGKPGGVCVACSGAVLVDDEALS